MANNVNTNLASRLFAYIEHKVDISQSLKDVYKNSVIFIGDEQQILVPQFNAYVGIGMTSYNNTVNRIAGVESDIIALKKEIGSNSVKGIGVQYSEGDNNTINEFGNGTGDVFNYNNKLSGDITLASLNDYNENTGFAYRGVIFAYNGDIKDNAHFGAWFAYNTTTGVVTYDASWQEDTSLPIQNATSGITLTYYYETKETVENGVTVVKPVNNRIVIDDKKTWSYMTKSYSYSLGFARDYTNDRIETLYHDLLGESTTVLVPVNGSQIVRIDDATGNQVLTDSNKFVYWIGAGVPEMPAPDTIESWYTDNELDVAKVIGNWRLVTEVPSDLSHAYYAVSTKYDNTYNMNIADGIQTLKEVAYILDQLSDGGIGTTTYLTKTDWTNMATTNSWAITEDTDNTYTLTGYTGTYYRVYVNGLPTTNSKKYAYYINTANPENLGIQIAYSIAGNSADIQDLHEHVEYNEKGWTTLRSISHYNIPNSLVTMYQYSNVDQFETTDTNQHLPVTITGQSTYNVGDTRMYTRLDLAVTYYTFNNVIGETPDDTVLASVTTDAEWKGIYKKADVTEIYGTKRPTGVTYYEIGNNDKFVEISDFSDAHWPSTLDTALSGTWNIYWIPEKNIPENDTRATSYLYANNKFKKVDSTYVANNISSVAGFYTQESGRYTYVNNPTVAENYYILEGDANIDYVQHALINGVNKIATTTWVSAYITDSQGAMDSKIDGILDAAKEYTNEKIKTLDSDFIYSYSDFYTYWAGNNPFYATEGTATHVNDALYAPGTTAYITELNSRYGEWRTWLNGLGYYKKADGSISDIGINVVSEFVDGSYAFNRMRSEVIANVYEIDGITYATSKELPTDDIVVRTNIWNEQRNNPNNMGNVTLTISTDKEGNLANAKQEALFAFVANIDPVTGLSNPRQIYAKYNTDKTYVKTPTPTAAEIEAFAGSANGALNTNWCLTYWTLSNDGTFVQSTNDEVKAFFLNATQSFDWKQLYNEEDAYYEVVVDSIDESTASGNTIATANILRPNENSDVTPIDITCNDEGVTNLYTVTTNEVKRTNYMKATVQHYDYRQKGGQGQNRFNLDINVTHIEDATIDNTGLADAYDVQNFIQNMFTWVNISASVTDEQLATISEFYTKYSTSVPVGVGDNADNIAQTASTNLLTGKTLYHYNGSQYVAIVNNGTIANDSYSVMKLARDVHDNVVASNAANAVSGSAFYALGYVGGNGADICQVYTRTQEAKTNPLNMTLTKVGQ